jgi:hypothetical protein
VAAASPHRLRWWRRQRRHLPAEAAVVVMAGMMHVTVMVCRPAAWLTATSA